ncbi:MAG: HNH endonuclease [Nostoc sp.]|uniref:HNH endonuclease n=1 Tax=Nostoc sp. TaxID=1180 RepID=UPI002FF6038F
MTETTKRRHKRICPKQMRHRKSKLIEKYGMNCFWCHCTLLPETITIDHYIPLSKGGNNKLRNLRLACAQCNSYRGNSMP